MTYNKQNWNDGASGGTPINAARLNYMENGIASAVPSSDTGWIAMPSANGYTVGGDGAHYRVVNGICYIQIHVVTSTATANAVFFTLPAGARPGYKFWSAGQYAGSYTGELKVFENGNITFNVANAPFVASTAFPVG